jgi:poly-gamma-glutamate capsule biosynthesis protein CapA/YwtB (metallophosphatase superfamily)
MAGLIDSPDNDSPNAVLPVRRLVFTGLLVCVVAVLLWNLNSEPMLDSIPLRTVDVPGSSILFLGDTHPGESYFQEYLADGVENVLQTKGYAYSFEVLSPLVRSSGLAVANLETPLTEDAGGLPGKSYNHWSSTTDTPDQLTRTGIRLVALANNHAMDQRGRGLADTVRALDQAGIDSVGAGSNVSEAYSPVIVRHTEVAGGAEDVTAIISVFEYLESHDERYGFYARGESPGVASAEMRSIRRVVSAIRNEFPEAFIVAFPHWGSNYEWRTRRQRTLGHQFIDAGIDLVIGHGAHNFQEIEQYRDHLILYGIGNFVFNSRGRYQKFDAHHFSWLANLDYVDEGGKASRRLKIYPIVSNNLLTGFQPRFVTAAEFGASLNLIRQRSAELGEPPAIKAGEDSFGRFFQIDL